MEFCVRVCVKRPGIFISRFLKVNNIKRDDIAAERRKTKMEIRVQNQKA